MIGFVSVSLLVVVAALIAALLLTWKGRQQQQQQGEEGGVSMMLPCGCCCAQRDEDGQVGIRNPGYLTTAVHRSDLKRSLLAPGTAGSNDRGVSPQQQLYDSVQCDSSDYTSVASDGISNHYSEVSFSEETSYNRPAPPPPPASRPNRSLKTFPVGKGRGSQRHNQVNVPHDNDQIYANVEVEKGGAAQQGEYEFDDSRDLGPADRHTMYCGQPPSTDSANHLYTYACVQARPELGGGSEHYREPAKDEDSLYVQFKALNVRLVKRSTIDLGNYLGSGQFGTVNSGMWRMSQQKIKVAIKTLNSNSHEDDKVRFLQEAAIMGQFNHINVIKMHGLVIEKEPFMIVLEFLPKGDLRQHLISLRPQGGVDGDLPQTLLLCCQQIAYGMRYLSTIKFVHRDLAARNILVAENGTCKVADFGMSRDLAHEDYYISHGGQIPVKWTSPEAMHFRKYSTASDVWSFGVVMYEIWSLGHKPFERYTNNQALSLVDEGVRLPSPPGCPREIYAFMIKCWNPVSSSRPTFDDAIKHLLMSKDILLKWSVKEKAVHLSASQLGADLKVAENLHKDLRDFYLQ